MNPIVVRMNEANISTKEQPVIGTDALGPCVGVLIYSKKHKKSVVFHTSTDWQPLVVESLIILADNNLISGENFSKAVSNLQLHNQFNLFDFDRKTKQEILTKKGLNIDEKEIEETLEVTIIPGYYKDNYNVALNMTKFFLTLEPLFTVRRNELPKKAVRIRMFEDLGSHEFFFNSETGKFVTEKVIDKMDSKGYRL